MLDMCTASFGKCSYVIHRNDVDANNINSRSAHKMKTNTQVQQHTLWIEEIEVVLLENIK